MDKKASKSLKKRARTDDALSATNGSELMDKSTRSSLQQPRRKTLPKEEFIDDFTKDALDDDVSEYQEHDSLAGLSSEMNSDHMEGIPDHLDVITNVDNMVTSSLKPN